MRIDYVNGHDEFDGSLWFKDGQYVGHDDQCDVVDFVDIGRHTTIELHHRQIKSDFSYEDLEAGLFFVKTLADAERFLEPSVEQEALF